VFVYDILQNVPLLSGLSAILIAQLLKVPLAFFSDHRLNWALIFSPGRMPSSHTAGMSALTTSVGFKDGLGSSLFALAFLMTAIVMFDAAGVRRQAGEHAALLNKLIFEEALIKDEVFRTRAHEQVRRLKEIIGHKPSEVLGGLALGIVVGLLWAYYGAV